MADVLLHVIDASGEEMDNQITVVEQVLSDIGASVSRLWRCLISATDLKIIR